MTKLKDGLYALYLRKSRADVERERFGEYETLTVHEHDMLSVAQHDGYILDKPYFKELVCGEHIADRIEFQKLMRKVEAGEYTGILVHEVSRLGRGEAMEYGYVLFTLKRTRTKVITLTRIYDPNNADDYKALQMEMFMSNMEFGNIRWRLTTGARSRAEMGSFVKSVPPFGYDRIKINGFWTLKANDDAPTVQYIFEEAAEGTPLGTIAHNMNAAGMRTPSGGCWSSSRLATIISNPHYMGKIRYNYYSKEIIPIDNFNYKVKNHFNDDCMIVDGLHEGIVSEELWVKANERKTGSTRVKHSKELKNPLAGLLVCKKCGRAMQRYVSGNNTPRYRHTVFSECDTHEAKVSVVLDSICDTLEAIVHDYEAHHTIGGTNSREFEIQALEKQFEQEERRLNKLMDLYFADAITMEEFKSKRTVMTENKEALQNRLKSLREETPQDTEEVMFTIRDSVKKLRDDTVSAQAKNDVLRSFIEYIEYENNAPARSRKDDIRLNIVFKK